MLFVLFFRVSVGLRPAVRFGPGLLFGLILVSIVESIDRTLLPRVGGYYTDCSLGYVNLRFRWG